MPDTMKWAAFVVVAIVVVALLHVFVTGVYHKRELQMKQAETRRIKVREGHQFRFGLRRNKSDGDHQDAAGKR